ncbi:hypothetical protein [Bellilinea sp.]|uniref:hypothetical protein n=1 Tax=Bellilinea sp. TaxID=2838785 RepID=UPI002ADE30CA|nr:hypothetical protein [Bellilinea sp.]
MAKITLWYPEERPAFVIYTEDGVEVGPTLGANEVYCDLCNAAVPLDPAPMVEGYVLCLDCLEKVVPDWRKQITPLLELMWRDQMEQAKGE